jgi:hypothetical protein
VVLAVDDTLWRRVGRKLHGTAWHHDGNGPGRHRPAWGHRWVVVGVIVALPFLDRAVCLPILARLWIPGDPDHTPLMLARELVDLVTAHRGPAGAPGRRGRLHRQAPASTPHPRHRDPPAARRRRAVRAGSTTDRQARLPSGQGQAAAGAGRAGRHDPLPVDPCPPALLRHDPGPGGPGDRLPVVWRARPPTRPGRAQPPHRRPRRLPAGPGHHRSCRHPRPGHRTLQPPLVSGAGVP